MFEYIRSDAITVDTYLIASTIDRVVRLPYGENHHIVLAANEYCVHFEAFISWIQNYRLRLSLFQTIGVIGCSFWRNAACVIGLI